MWSLFATKTALMLCRPNGEGVEEKGVIEYDKFQMSLGRLEEQHTNYQNLDVSLPSVTQEAIAESVIQRFETCYDCLWKVLKRYLC